VTRGREETTTISISRLPGNQFGTDHSGDLATGDFDGDGRTGPVRETLLARDALTMRNSTARSHDAVIRAYDEAGNVIETHEQAGGILGLSR
jgi:hypothetical protein